MAPDDHSGARPAGPVVLRIKLRYDDLDAMVQRFASNVGKSGLFLPTKSIQPIGTEVKFELRLANDAPVLVGLGRVKHVRPHDPAHPKAAFGMAIELMRVSREGREVIIRMIERRRALGLPDVAIPMPEDAEAARRAEVDSHPRADTSAVVREAMAQLASARPSDQLLGAKPASGPIGVAKEPSGGIATQEPSGGVATKEPSGGIATKEPSGATAAASGEPRRPSAPLLTAPRTNSGAIPVAPLHPEKSRPRRPRVQDVIDKAAELSAPMIAALPTPTSELELHVDLDSVLDRARALAGGELDAELETLREAAAAPIEISVEAASAELARQLGGKPIAKRDRSGSARWAPPPSVVELRAKMPVLVDEPVESPRESDDAVSAAAAPDVPAATAPESVTSAASEPATSAASEPAASAAPEPIAEAAPQSFSSRTRAETEGAPSAQIAAVVQAALDASPALDELDATPVFPRDDFDDAFVANATTTTAVDEPLHPRTMKPRPLTAQPDADDERVELLASGEYELADLGDDAPQERTQIGGSSYGDPSIPDQLAAQLDEQLAEAEAEAERDLADALARGDVGAHGAPAYESSDAAAGDDAEEISELDVLAEADEEDADLLASQADHDTVAPPVADPYGYDTVLPAPRPYDEDTVAPGVSAYSYAPSVVDSYARDDVGERQQEAYGYESGAPAPADEHEGYDTIAPPLADQHGYDTLAPPLADQHGYDTLAPPLADQHGSDARGQGYGHDHDRPSVEDFAARLDLGDDDDPPPSEEFDHDAAREFDAGVPPHDYGGEAMEPVVPAAVAEARAPRRRRSSSEPSSSYTFAENYPQAGLQLGPDDNASNELDEPHGYAPAPTALAQPSRPVGPDPRLLRYGRATTGSTEDLEDALAALDVDLDDLSNLDRRRPRRPTPSSSTGPRPLPGLPIERAADRSAPTRTAAPLNAPAPTRTAAPTNAPAPTRTAAPTNAPAPMRAPASPTRPPAASARATKPPPIPAAARKAPTQQVPLVHAPPPKRASTDDDGVIIDFDDDE